MNTSCIECLQCWKEQLKHPITSEEYIFLSRIGNNRHIGASPAVIMSIYNHSSMEITKRYLSIEQDDKDEVYRNMIL